MFKNIAFGRFSVLFYFLIWFLVFSFLLRIIFLVWQYDEVSWNVISIGKTLFIGLFFDIGTAAFISILPIFYYSLLPNRWIGTLADKVLVWFFTSLTVVILIFTFFAELTFWDEFRRRFNFIAVDYLIYTFEVVANIQQSYPLPLLIGGVLIMAAIILFVFYRRHAFINTFTNTVSIKPRAFLLGIGVVLALFYAGFINNIDAEWSPNRYNSEISKSGIYSFFAAFRNNQMRYDEFYTTLNVDKAFAIVKKQLHNSNTKYIGKGYSVRRRISAPANSEVHKNVVFILVESLSASFLTAFGNQENITPFLDSLSNKSVFFENLYATGTRTVRGMEAVTLCIPPTPGQSIVKRPENHNLYTVANVFKSKGYDCNFFYGGDGYFDNMNSFFGSNGFNIYDRGRGSVLGDHIKTVRNNIDDSAVTFENAWGICDEDIFNVMITAADQQYKNKRPFLNFIMTTSNHRPYTYPSGKIDIPSGVSRQGAVKYTDYAIRKLFEKASQKPWFKNTVFIIVADHCAKSAGKDEIDVANYHIPAFIINLPEESNRKIGALCSQLDLFPTLFSLFQWEYESNFFGKDVLDENYEPRALLGTYRKLVLMKSDSVMILSDQKKQGFYRWEKSDNSLKPVKMNNAFLAETISWYQTADYLFTNKLLQ